MRQRRRYPQSGEGNSEIVIKTISSLDNAQRMEIVNALGNSFGITEEDVLASEQFGPSVGDELKKNAVIAGNPAKVVKQNIHWIRENLNTYSERMKNEKQA